MTDPADTPWTPPIRRTRRCGARTRSGAPCRGAAVRARAAALIDQGERLLCELADDGDGRDGAWE